MSHYMYNRANDTNTSIFTPNIQLHSTVSKNDKFGKLYNYLIDECLFTLQAAKLQPKTTSSKHQKL